MLECPGTLLTMTHRPPTTHFCRRYDAARLLTPVKAAVCPCLPRSMLASPAAVRVHGSPSRCVYAEKDSTGHLSPLSPQAEGLDPNPVCSWCLRNARVKTRGGRQQLLSPPNSRVWRWLPDVRWRSTQRARHVIEINEMYSCNPYVHKTICRRVSVALVWGPPIYGALT